MPGSPRRCGPHAGATSWRPADSCARRASGSGWKCRTKPCHCEERSDEAIPFGQVPVQSVRYAIGIDSSLLSWWTGLLVDWHPNHTTPKASECQAQAGIRTAASIGNRALRRENGVSTRPGSPTARCPTAAAGPEAAVHLPARIVDKLSITFGQTHPAPDEQNHSAISNRAPGGNAPVFHGRQK